MSMDGSTVVSRPTALIAPPHQQKTNNASVQPSTTTTATASVTPLNNSRNGAVNATVNASTTANDSTNKSSKTRIQCDSPTNNYDYNSLEEEQENVKLDLNHQQTHTQQQQKQQQNSLLSADSAGSEFNCNKSNGSISGASSNSALEGEKGITNGGSAGSLTTSLTNGDNVAVTANGDGNINGVPITSAAAAAIAVQSKKRISSSRTPTRKARRIKFYRNGDRFYPGITIPVSNERYRSFESLFEDLTRLLEDNVKIPGAVRNIYAMNGKKISNLEELEDGQSYVCSCNNEGFKKIEYNLTSQTLAQMTLSANKGNTARLSGGKVARPGSPSKNSISSGISNSSNGTNCANGTVNSLQTLLSERNSVVHPRIVTLIRNGTRPRKIMRLLLNKRNSPSFDHVLTAITQIVRLDTGYVRKVFTLAGTPVTQLADFFGKSDVFFAYGTERVNNPDDFELEANELRTLQAVRKVQGTAGTTCKGPKPKMPVKKSRNLRKIEGDPSSAALDEVVEQGSNDSGIETTCLPVAISERYTLGPIVGDGNFAVVLKVLEKRTNQPFALKIIDKSKCKGKEHYIDAEVRVMKKLQHPYIISLIMDVDMGEYMYLVLEYVSGGDLFDAITRVTRFSEDQARVMIKHLASAMAYLHSMSIVHRDIKPENLLVELDEQGNVIELKLADFGLACEVTEPLYAVCGTPTYVAPEILMETGYGLKIDVWAAGIILYILLCGFPPFVSPDNEQEPLFDAIIAGVYEFPDPYWSDIGNGVRDLIANMLQNDPDVRFTSEDILDHCWTMNEESEEYTS